MNFYIYKIKFKHNRREQIYLIKQMQPQNNKNMNKLKVNIYIINKIKNFIYMNQGAIKSKI